MARVTIEDCSKIVPSRFELVVLAAQRAKEISAGAKLTVDRDNDKNAVVALREISLKNVDTELLKEAVIKRYQKVQHNELVDAPDDGMSEESEIAAEIKSYAASTEEMPQDGFYDDADIEETE